MRLVTCQYRNRDHLGVDRGDHIVLPALADPGAVAGDMLSLIDGGASALAGLAAAVEAAPPEARIARDELRLLAPIPRPRQNVICLGWNYVEHIAEAASVQATGKELPEHPVVFTKSVYSVIGPDAEIAVDAGFSTQIDWEVELTVVIGRGGRAIPRERALEHVFGYTIINDISVRDVQFRHKQFFLGKSMDGGCPMGPCIVTADEIRDPQALDIRSRVNGEIRQDSNTRHQIFDVATTIATVSRGMTLHPGDLIATGTPSGVGFARTPAQFLGPGDTVECEVETIGRLANPVVARTA
jgi:2-keto-4-pentenoate hydratase/2-oxohepta-3-ene-1,7-dioic acid hydratase in catechol pathway